MQIKILFQQLWEMKVNWDNQVPESVRESWLKWRSELGLLSTKYASRCYHDKKKFVASTELHGFLTLQSRHTQLLFTSEWNVLMEVHKLHSFRQRQDLYLSKDTPYLV